MAFTKIESGAIAPGAIAESDLAINVYTTSEVDSALATKADLNGATFTGAVAATAFTGDGAALTNLPKEIIDGLTTDLRKTNVVVAPWYNSISSYNTGYINKYEPASFTSDRILIGSLAGEKAVLYDYSGNVIKVFDNPNTVYPTSPTTGDLFGYSVALSDSYVVIGARVDKENGTLNNNGSIYVWSTSDLNTVVHAITLSTPIQAYLGNGPMKIVGDRLFVGVKDYSSSTVGGVVLEYNLITGALTRTITNPNAYGTVSGDYFGWTIGTNQTASLLVVTALYEDTAAVSNESAVYVFDANATLIRTIRNPYSPASYDNFGRWQVTAYDEKVFISTNDVNNTGQGFLCYDSTTGNILYTFLGQSIEIVNGRLFVCKPDKYIKELNIADGTVINTFDISQIRPSENKNAETGYVGERFAFNGTDTFALYASGWKAIFSSGNFGDAGTIIFAKKQEQQSFGDGKVVNISGEEIIGSNNRFLKSLGVVRNIYVGSTYETSVANSDGYYQIGFANLEDCLIYLDNAEYSRYTDVRVWIDEDQYIARTCQLNNKAFNVIFDANETTVINSSSTVYLVFKNCFVGIWGGTWGTSFDINGCNVEIAWDDAVHFGYLTRYANVYFYNSKIYSYYFTVDNGEIYLDNSTLTDNTWNGGCTVGNGTTGCSLRSWNNSKFNFSSGTVTITNNAKMEVGAGGEINIGVYATTNITNTSAWQTPIANHGGRINFFARPTISYFPITINRDGHTPLVANNYAGLFYDLGMTGIRCDSSDDVGVKTVGGISSFGGIVTKPNQPSFHAFGNSGMAASNVDAKIAWPSLKYNVGNHYNATNGNFTAPIAGTYIFGWTTIGGNVDSVWRLRLYINDVRQGDIHLRIDTTATGTEYGTNGMYTLPVQLSANDTVSIWGSNDSSLSWYGSNQPTNDYYRFWGYLIG